jgi:hypothetical protein
MTNLYSVSARVRVRSTTLGPDGTPWTWEGSKELPTFYLDGNLQGIISTEQAERIARKVLDPLDYLGDDLQVTAYELYELYEQRAA